MIAHVVIGARRRGRPPGSRDRNGAAARVNVAIKRTARWRAFCAAFGARLRQIREERDVAASELAAAIGANVLTVHAWERGRSAPAVATLVAIATALRCTLADILPDEARLR